MTLQTLDLNLLVDLDALLQAGSVAGAAQRLHVSAPAMSRRLARLRDAFGDPLFVPAGRGLVPTSRALALREAVTHAIDQVRGVLQPPRVDFATLERTFTIRANDGFAGAWAARLAAAMRAEAPGTALQFLPRASRDPDALRSGEVDLDILVVKGPEPGILTERLFTASFVGVVRRGHPLCAGRRRARITAEAFVAWQHIATSPGRRSCAAVDVALAERGLRRTVALVAPGFQAALAMALASDFVAVMPAPFVQWAMTTLPLQTFALPFALPAVDVEQCWHQRQHADPVHAWLRRHVQAVCAQAAG
ncbi:LysR family transcriptional regulator [Telluria sp. Tellsp104]